MIPSTSWTNPGSVPGDNLTLIDDLLGEQQTLTAVERFARAHDRDELPALEKHYRRLLPASAPMPGQQYAFEVDLDKCSGCKACVSACHSLNGLDETETWRGVGLLVGDPAEDVRARRGAAAFQQHITTACHHCVDPGCLNGCPVLAYDKDALTGIVRHLDDQCIGCQYCVMKCPYEVPQYSKARGIVRKCDMCSSRIAVGEAPACVQACPTSAIRITVVNQAKIRGKYRWFNSELRTPNSEGSPKSEVRSSAFSIRHSFGTRSSEFGIDNSFLPASPDPAITLPTTRFVTQRTLPENLYAGDHSAIRRSDPHLPLVSLLVLSQLAIGASLAALFIQPALPLLLAALGAGGAAMATGSLHLGQPLKAWRAFVGWRKSWFSREVITLGAFVPLVAQAAAVHWLPPFAWLAKILIPSAAVAGLLTVTCSAMIYVDTRREFWSASRSFTKFFGTTLLLGAAVALTVLSFGRGQPNALTGPAVVLILITLAKLAFERRILLHLVDAETPAQTPLNKTARLLTGELGAFARLRIACGLLGGVALPAMLLAQVATNAAAIPALATAALALCVAGECLERYLFFTAVVTQKMPGGLAS